METRSVNMFPIFDPYSVLVYSAKAANVDSVFVNGRCLVRGKRLTGLSLEDSRAELSRGWPISQGGGNVGEDDLSRGRRVEETMLAN